MIRGRGLRRVLAVLTAAGLGSACGGDDPMPPGPEPGVLTVRFQSQATDDRGVLIELAGPQIGALAPSTGYEIIENGSASVRRAIVAGVIRNGALLRFDVPDLGDWARYTVRVEQVSGGPGWEQRDAASYQVFIDAPIR